MSIEENNRLGDLLKYEADKNYCREVMTVASGQNLEMGTVVGIKTATDEIKIVSIADEETDGSDLAFGVLLEDMSSPQRLNQLKARIQRFKRGNKRKRSGISERRMGSD